MKLIIGVGGRKNSGKDMVCSIFNYINYKTPEQAVIIIGSLIDNNMI